ARATIADPLAGAPMAEPHRRQEPVRDALEASEAQSRCELVSDVTYALSLAIDKERPDYDGRVLIRFACARPGTGTFLDFTGKVITSLKLNGQPLDPSLRSAHRI